MAPHLTCHTTAESTVCRRRRNSLPHAMSTIAHSLRDHKEPTRPELFTHSFALPDGQVPLNDVPAVMSLSNPNDDASSQEDEVYAGRLTLTEKFLCFESLDRRSCKMSLPLYCVRRVERLNTKRSGVFALAVVVWHGMRIVSAFVGLRRGEERVADFSHAYRSSNSTHSARNARASALCYGTTCVLNFPP